ncbi:MAG TPA: hypothetical protein VJ723_01410 [Candidatus Angelobacter sp.]|nr:hypothetical protein [Candidatus Angelobacter sp.]
MNLAVARHSGARCLGKQGIGIGRRLVLPVPEVGQRPQVRNHHQMMTSFCLSVRCQDARDGCQPQAGTLISGPANPTFNRLRHPEAQRTEVEQE